jgi:menaquinone-dependent protoporphyrinogen IX oxidase
MRALVVYESMYGNTHEIARAIAEGIGETDEATVVAVADASPELVEAADLLVVGGPTHVHGLSRPSTRRAAAEEAEKPGSTLAMDPGAGEVGIRDWLAGLGHVSGLAAAFDTRIDAAPVLTGHASSGIAKRLRHHGCSLVTKPESFLVDKSSQLLSGEAARAHAWGVQLASEASAVGAGQAQRQ